MVVMVVMASGAAKEQWDEYYDDLLGGRLKPDMLKQAREEQLHRVGRY